MSAKAIRKALDMVDVSFSDFRESADVRDEAMAELKALRDAAKVLTQQGHEGERAAAWSLLRALAEDGEETK